jgi:hypothetical protein
VRTSVQARPTADRKVKDHCLLYVLVIAATVLGYGYAVVLLFWFVVHPNPARHETRRMTHLDEQNC